MKLSISIILFFFLFSTVSYAQSGLGFAISANGYVITSYHLVQGQGNISVRCLSGDKNVSYSAKMMMADKKNDIAMIKINDPAFLPFSQIPYVIKSESTAAGSAVFGLGCPSDAVGSEINLSAGLISSVNGLRGDSASYSIATTTEPGCNGSPLFDKDGNIIGVICAKGTGPENLSYAVKGQYLSAFISLLNEQTPVQKHNFLKGLPQAKQASIARNFIFSIGMK